MEARKSRVAWSASTRGQGDASREIETKVKDLLDEIGIAIEQEAKISQLDLYLFPIFRVFEVVGVVTDNNIFYFISPFVGGFLPKVIWYDKRQQNRNCLTRDQFRKYFEHEFGWKSVWIIELDSNLLDLQTEERKEAIQKVARDKINEKIEERDREARLVSFKPIFGGRSFIVQNDLCFVLMTLQEPFLAYYKDHIKPIFEDLGLTVINANDIKRSATIIEDIWEYINKSRLIVADVTGRNPNVFYELGIAHTIGKDYIILTQNGDDVPFDIKHLRYFPYSDNADSWKHLRSTLQEAAREMIH